MSSSRSAAISCLRFIASIKFSSRTACCFCCCRSVILVTVAIRCLICSATTKSSRATAACLRRSNCCGSDSDDDDCGGGGVLGGGVFGGVVGHLDHTSVGGCSLSSLGCRTRRKGTSKASENPWNCSVSAYPRMQCIVASDHFLLVGKNFACTCCPTAKPASITPVPCTSSGCRCVQSESLQSIPSAQLVARDAGCLYVQPYFTHAAPWMQGLLVAAR